VRKIQQPIFQRFIIIAGLLFITAALPSGCEKKKELDKKQYWNIVSIRTLGLAFLEENKLEEARNEFSKLIEEAPDEASGYANLGLVYLRMGKYDEAIPHLITATKKQPDDPDILLILAKTYEQKGDTDKALEVLLNIVELDPANLKALYNLSEIYGQSRDSAAINKRTDYLRKLVAAAPGNIVVRLQYIEQLIQSAEIDPALEQMEQVKQSFPEFSDVANVQYMAAMDQLRNNEPHQAGISIMKFHNLLKLSTLYQSSVKDLRGPGGALIGFPVITISETVAGVVREDASILEVLQFTDATASAELTLPAGSGKKYQTALATGDYNNDGDIDIYFSRSTPSGPSEIFLFNNNSGRFSEVAAEQGVKHEDQAKAVKFFDFNNDGYLDLLVGTESTTLLFQNNNGIGFKEIGTSAGLSNNKSTNMVLALDADHDGDLDIFAGRASEDIMLQNNADGSFTDVTAKMGVSGQPTPTTDATMGDLDEDGDIDFVVRHNEGLTVFLNLRQGQFQDATAASGLPEMTGEGVIAMGDYNNDGFPDLLSTANDSQQIKLLANDGDARFTEDIRSAALFASLQTLRVNDVTFLDFDNDGFKDLLVAGEPVQKSGQGLFLLHNDGTGVFEDVSELLPKNITTVQQISIADYNGDGDLDIFITGSDGTIKLLRNDGGNTNHYLKMKLVGLRTGSGKNNHFGIGAKIEVRAQDLYQMQTVTAPEILFGLGNRKSADVVRIQWTNGVPQNIFTPSADRSLIESQVLKGSCPFLYAWNGEKYVFVKDMMWKSALGMPLGIMGGNTAYAYPGAAKEYMKIPGEVLQPKNGYYSLQITEELWETVYFDKAELMVVDHPGDYEIFVDERFSLPPYADLKIYAVHEKQHPITATDGQGNDLLPLIQTRDDQYIANFIHSGYQGITNTREVILDLGNIEDENNLFLFLQGWIFPTDASINVATAQSAETGIVPLQVQVINQQGEWITVIENLGFPLGKDKTIIADLSNKFPSGDHRVKLVTNMEIYWDHIFYSNCTPEKSIVTNTLTAAAADFHYRGFSHMYRKGGRYGPHWFDYDQVTRGQKWRDLIGDYTRYGDVKELLQEGDDKYIIANAGDEITVQFDARNLPELPAGWQRDFLIYSEGWVKDGDLNTAHSQTVEPLPYHNIGQYPYGPGDGYPTDSSHQAYRAKYNTRKVTPARYNSAIREYRPGEQ
jgi:tetratricopeptide (TPR) repeat protein